MDLGDGCPLVNQHNYGKSPFLMGKSTISMAIFNSYVKLPEGKYVVVRDAAGEDTDLSPRGHFTQEVAPIF